MKTLQNVKEVTEEIQRLHPNLNDIVVSIDGADGSGKTTIAKQIAAAIGFIHMNVDTFHNNDQRGYLKHIRYTELQGAIAVGLTKARGVIVEGICMREVADCISLKPNTSIYVKRMRTENGHTWWADSHRLLSDLTPEEYLRHSWQEAIDFNQALGENVQESDPLADSYTKDIYIYHFQRRPYEHSDIIFENVFEERLIRR